MAYPSKNTTTYTSPTKNTSTSTNSDHSGKARLKIDDTFFLLIQTGYRLLLEPTSFGWSYQTKN